MSTVGYGDQSPVHKYEKLFIIFVMLLSCGLFGWSINSIGGIIDELTKRKIIFDRGVTQLIKNLD